MRSFRPRLTFMAALVLMYGPAKKLSRVNANLQQVLNALEQLAKVEVRGEEAK